MSEQSLPADALPEYAERVLDVAELIPPGRVMTYGDVAEWLEEGGPRQVGRVMALYGGAVPWWRVIRADGVLLPGHELEALGHYRAESTPLKEASRLRGPSPARRHETGAVGRRRALGGSYLTASGIELSGGVPMARTGEAGHVRDMPYVREAGDACAWWEQEEALLPPHPRA